MIRMALALLSVAFAANAPETADIKLPDGKTVQFQLPNGWTSSQAHSNPKAPTMELHSKNDDAGLVVTFMPDSDGHMATQQQAEELLTKVATAQYVAGSVEKKVNLKSLNTKDRVSTFAEFTDADLVGKPNQPGQFKVVGTGILRFGDYAGTFTILGPAFDDPGYKAAKEALVGAKLTEN